MLTRNRIKLGVGGAVAAAIALGVWLLPGKLPPQPGPVGNVAVTPLGHGLRNGGGDTSTAKLAMKGGTPTVVSHRAAFEAAHSYWDYAKRTLPAAQAGDRDAQFYLSRALERCQSDLRMYLQQRGRPLTEVESLQWAVKRNLPLDLAQQAYERCHKFLENGPGEFGDASEWLGRATLAGQPLAQAITASRILVQRTTDELAKAGAVPVTILSIAPDTAHMDPRRLFREAVESGDPEVLFHIGEANVALHLSTGNDGSTEQLSWWLVACEEGFDCSPSADWVKNSCYVDPQCASIGPSEIVEYFAGNNWPQVQQRAQELKTKIDAHEWDELGLGRKIN